VAQNWACRNTFPSWSFSLWFFTWECSDSLGTEWSAWCIRRQSMESLFLPILDPPYRACLSFFVKTGSQKRKLWKICRNLGNLSDEYYQFFRVRTMRDPLFEFSSWGQYYQIHDVWIRCIISHHWELYGKDQTKLFYRYQASLDIIERGSLEQDASTWGKALCACGASLPCQWICELVSFVDVCDSLGVGRVCADWLLIYGVQKTIAQGELGSKGFQKKAFFWRKFKNFLKFCIL